MSFASRSVGVHLGRGVAGFGALVAAVALGPGHPILAVLGLVAGLIALRGCPLCWTLGLVETVHARVTGRSAPPSCVDGSCATPPSAMNAPR